MAALQYVQIVIEPTGQMLFLCYSVTYCFICSYHNVVMCLVHVPDVMFSVQ